MTPAEANILNDNSKKMTPADTNISKDEDRNANKKPEDEDMTPVD